MKWPILTVGLLAVVFPIFLRFRSGGPETLAQATSENTVPSTESDYSKWETLYENASLEQVTQEIAMLRNLLDQGTKDYYEMAFARGDFLVEGHTSPDQGYVLKNPADELCARRFLRSGEVTKVILPRDQFPEMYELREQIAWLGHREAELAHAPPHGSVW